MTEMSPEMVEEVVRRFSSLADASRIRILNRLRLGACNVTLLSRDLGIAQASVSKHLSILRNAGLVAVDRRGAQAICRIHDPSVMDMCQIVCDGINAHLSEKQKAISPTTSPKAISPNPSPRDSVEFSTARSLGQ